MMKRRFTLLLLVPLICTSMHAYVPIFYSRGWGYYPDAVMDIEHDAQHIYLAKGDGLVIINKTTGEQTVYSISQGTLAYTPISLAMHGDELWIGTVEEKVLCYSNGSIQTYDWGIIGPVTNIVFDTKGSMYLSSIAGTGYRINISTKTVEEQIETFNKLSGGVTGHLCIDGNDALWIGNYFGTVMKKYGLAKYTQDEGTQYMINDHPEWHGYYVSSLAVDDEGCIWYATYGNSEAGLWLSKIQNDEVVVAYEYPYDGWDMMFDRQQRLWMLGRNGPLVMMKDGEFSCYNCMEESNIWTSIDIDGDAIYIGTDKGVLKYENNDFTILDVEVGVPSGITPSAKYGSDVKSSAVYDMQGRLIGKPEKGVYIQNGKKFVNK